MIYSYRISITGDVFYYRKGKLIDLDDVPENKRPVLSKEERKLVKVRRKISGCGDYGSNKEPDSGIYYTDKDGVRYYLIVKIINGKPELIAVEKDVLTKSERKRAQDANEFFKAHPPESKAKAKDKANSRRKAAKTAKASNMIPPDEQVYTGKVGRATFFWRKITSPSGYIHRERVARKRISDDQAENALPVKQLDDLIREQFRKEEEHWEQYRDEQNEWETREEEWRKQEEEWRKQDGEIPRTTGAEDVYIPVPQMRVTAEEFTGMKQLLADQGIADRSAWKKWCLSNHPDKNPNYDGDLVARVNTAAKVVLGD